MTTSSSSAAEKKNKLKIWKKILLFATCLFFVVFIYFNQQESNPFIIKTLELNGSKDQGDTLFKMNCVGCHGITARGLVGPDLHSVTERLSDSKIIQQVIEGRTPPMPSFDIDPQRMSNLLRYLHSLK